MKKILIFKLIAAGFLFLSAQAHAADAPPADLAGSEFKVYMFCLNNVGDYCDKQKIKNDTFSFDEESFSMKYFEGDLWGLAGDGEYSSSGSTFDASYTATKDISLKGIKKYSFEINGFILEDNFLLGRMDIEYKENKLFDDKKEKGSAYFLGIKN